MEEKNRNMDHSAGGERAAVVVVVLVDGDPRHGSNLDSLLLPVVVQDKEALAVDMNLLVLHALLHIFNILTKHQQLSETGEKKHNLMKILIRSCLVEDNWSS